MKSKFLTELKISVCPDNESVYQLDADLVYDSELLKQIVIVPKGFYTDLASVPRMPIAYWFYGGRSHREAVIHDALYRIDCPGNVSYNTANKVFLEAMAARGKGWFIRYGMYLGVCMGGWTAWHKKKMLDKL